MEPITEQSLPISAVLLCGGASKRMGRDKALMTWEGETLLDRALEVLRAIARDVMIAPGSLARYQDRGLPEVLDGEPGQGPSAGILAGLAKARYERVLFAAVDLPELGRCPLKDLVALARTEDADIATLDDGRQRPPLVLCIHRRVLSGFEQAYAAGARRIIDLTRGHSSVSLPVDPQYTVNWNRPQDLPAVAPFQSGETE